MLNTQPYLHQQEAINLALKSNNFALFAEPGTGKTLVTLAVAYCRYVAQDGQTPCFRQLVICPKTVMGVWAAEIEKHLDCHSEIAVITGSKKQKQAKLKESYLKQGLVTAIINYESLASVRTELMNWQPDMVVCDESHRIKNRTSQMSKAAWQIGREATYRMILTGTPMPNGPLDLWGQYRFLDDGKTFGTSYKNFESYYAEKGGYMGYEILRYQNLDNLKEKVRATSYQCRLEEVLDMPGQTDHVIPVELEPKARRIYEDLKKDAAVKLGEETLTAPIVLTQLLRLQQVTGGFLPSTLDDAGMHPVSLAKLDALEDVVVDTLIPNRKMVIFARFIAEIDHILARLDTLHISWGVIVGATPQEDRDTIIKDFQDGFKTEVLVCQVATGGVGVTLTAATHAVFYSMGYSSAEYEQAKARIYRAGQTKPVVYTHLVCKDTIDETVLKVLQDKKDISELVLRVKEEIQS